MFETRGQVSSSLYNTLHGFCRAIVCSAKTDTAHCSALWELVSTEYVRGFYPSLRVFTKMREFVQHSYFQAVSNRPNEIGNYVPMIVQQGTKRFYFLRWSEENLTITLTIFRESHILSEVHIVANDVVTVQRCAKYVGLITNTVTYTPDTKFTLREVAKLSWNESALGANIPMWEWQNLISKYGSK